MKSIGTEWEIKLINEDEILKLYKDSISEDGAYYCHGLTVYSKQIIYINSNMIKEAQIKTLKHELTHCFIWNNGLYNAPHYTEEMACDLVACSNNFINKIVDEYKEVEL